MGTPQIHHDHRRAPLCTLDEGPLAGLRHRTVIDREVGAVSLALWQEEHLPGFVVPLHLHDCEEIISVVEGTIRATIRDASVLVGPQQSILIHEGLPHGFQVVGDEPVRLLAIFSSASPGIFRLDGTPSAPPWMGGASGHLEAP